MLGDAGKTHFPEWLLTRLLATPGRVVIVDVKAPDPEIEASHGA